MNPICIFCKEEVDKNTQPWDYLFPSQVFHLGCKSKIIPMNSYERDWKEVNAQEKPTHENVNYVDSMTPEEREQNKKLQASAVITYTKPTHEIDEDIKGGTCSKCGHWKGGAYGMNGDGVQSRHTCHEIGWEECDFGLLNDEQIKNFIKKTLTHQKESILSKLEAIQAEAIKHPLRSLDNGFESETHIYNIGYDQALADAVEVVKNTNP